MNNLKVAIFRRYFVDNKQIDFQNNNMIDKRIIHNLRILQNISPVNNTNNTGNQTDSGNLVNFFLVQTNMDSIILLYLILVVLIPLITAVLLKYMKNINIFILSFKRILTLMITDSLYELQFFQMFSIFKFVNFDSYNQIMKNYLKSIYKFSFLDWYITANSVFLDSTDIPNAKSKYYSITNEIILFLTLIGMGIIFSILFGIIRICHWDYKEMENEMKINEINEKMENHENHSEKHQNHDENSNNKVILSSPKKKLNDDKINNINKDKSHLSGQKLINHTENSNGNESNIDNVTNNGLNNNQNKFIKNINHRSIDNRKNQNRKGQIYLQHKDFMFSRCSYSSIRNYLFFNYFIRIYQFTLVRLVLNFAFISSSTSQNSEIEAYNFYIIYFIFIIWVCFLPLLSLGYLRNNQQFLMSRKKIIKFGGLYLSYRGISKDIYAILMQMKFILVPFFCIKFNDGNDFIYYICGFIYIYYIFFVTLSKPFAKVWKVFNESLSFLILIIFCFSNIILKKIDSNNKSQPYANYVSLSLILGLLVIRSFRIFIDTTKRVMEAYSMRMPKEGDFEKTNKDKKIIEMNHLLLANTQKNDLIQDMSHLEKFKNKEDEGSNRDYEYDENAEYNVESIGDEDEESVAQDKFSVIKKMDLENKEDENKNKTPALNIVNSKNTTNKGKAEKDSSNSSKDNTTSVILSNTGTQNESSSNNESISRSKTTNTNNRSNSRSQNSSNSNSYNETHKSKSNRNQSQSSNDEEEEDEEDEEEESENESNGSPGKSKNNSNLKNRTNEVLKKNLTNIREESENPETMENTSSKNLRNNFTGRSNNSKTALNFNRNVNEELRKINENVEDDYNNKIKMANHSKQIINSNDGSDQNNLKKVKRKHNKTWGKK